MSFAGANVGAGATPAAASVYSTFRDVSFTGQQVRFEENVFMVNARNGAGITDPTLTNGSVLPTQSLTSVSSSVLLNSTTSTFPGVNSILQNIFPSTTLGGFFGVIPTLARTFNLQLSYLSSAVYTPPGATVNGITNFQGQGNITGLSLTATIGAGAPIILPGLITPAAPGVGPT